MFISVCTATLQVRQLPKESIDTKQHMPYLHKQTLLQQSVILDRFAGQATNYTNLCTLIYLTSYTHVYTTLCIFREFQIPPFKMQMHKIFKGEAYRSKYSRNKYFVFCRMLPLMGKFCLDCFNLGDRVGRNSSRAKPSRLDFFTSRAGSFN